jgi:PAS domain S-box-containing protein
MNDPARKDNQRRSSDVGKLAEDRFREIVSVLREGIWAIDKDNRTTYVNPVLAEMLGYTPEEMHGKTVLEFVAPELQEQALKTLERHRQGEGGQLEFELRRKDSADIHVVLSASPLKDADGNYAGAVAALSDITERKRVEQTLSDGEERMKRSQEIAHLGIWELDLVNNRLTWSDEVYRIFGLQPQEFGATYGAFLEHVHPDDRAAVDAAYTGSLRENRDTYEIEHRVVRTNTGEVRCVHERCQHYRDASGRIIRSVGMVHDITERKKREDELYRLNRTLRALSNSNQVMMRARDESEYLKEACIIITEDCGHELVWIGYAEDDKDKTVWPVAYAGFEEGYLETLKITWADTERGRGPTGTSIRTGKPSMCRNMLTDPKFAPWRAEALKRGYASSIVLPLMTGGKAFGALNIYSKEPDPFSESEVKLLTELASDISYGIETLRMRSARAKAEEALKKAKNELEVLVQERTAELEKSVRKVEAERGRFNEVLETLPAYVILLTPDHRVAFANSVFRERFGESHGKRCYEFLFGRSEPCENCETYKVLKTDAPQRWEWTGPDGRFYDIYDYPFTDTDGSRLILEMGIDITERKNTAAALQRSEERFRNAMDNMLEATAIIGFDWTFIYVNETGARYRHKKKEDLIGRTLFEVHPDIEKTEIYAAYQHSMKERVPQRLVTRFAYPDGTANWFEVSIQPVPQGIFVLSLDVTERKKAEDAARQANAYNRTLIEASVDPFVTIGTDGRITDVNKATEQFTGHSRQDLIGTDFSNYFTEPEKARQGYQKVFKTGEVHDYALDLKHREGTVFHVMYNASLYRDEAGKPVGIFAVARDITQRKKAEDAARRANAYNRSLIEASVDPFVTIGPDGKITDVNKATEKFTGYSRQDLIGTDFSNYFTEPEKARQGYQKVFETGEVRDYALDLKHANGIVFHVMYNASLYRDEAGRPVGIFASARDVTDARRVEEQLRQKEAELLQSQKMEAIGRLAGGVAHDLNNMMTVVTGYADRVLKRRTTDRQTCEEVREIKAAGERSTGLVRQLLAFSRKQILQPKVLDLNAVITDLMSMLRRVVREDIIVAVELEPGLGNIKADPTQIQQVIMNLVVNARDAMPGGGKLTISTGDVTPDKAHARSNPGSHPGRFISLSVADTGCGMDEETQSHIFEPFFTTKGTGEGTGLGLSTVYGIVNQSGGHISFESKLGEGTIFTIYFPVVEEKLPQKPVQKTGEALAGSETILLVEDEQVLRDLAALELEDLGYKVVKAQNASEALAAAQKHKASINLVLADVIVPGLGGKRIADILSVILPDIKVLFMSGHTEKYIVEHGVLTPDTAFLEKPFTSEALAQKVREVLDTPAKKNKRGSSAANS